MVSPECEAGDCILFFESTLHSSLPWFGPPGTERRSILMRMAALATGGGATQTPQA